MLKIIENQSLKAYNTFGFELNARYFSFLNETKDIAELLQSQIYKSNQVFIIGGGSNLLFLRDFNGLIVQPCFRGIEILDENDEQIFVRAMAGENWDEFVAQCVENNWGGLENLSLIPGKVGSSPIQNIGAYGVELKDVFYSLNAIRLDTGELITMDNAACEFGYRDSIFKRELKHKLMIVSVVFKLSKNIHLPVTYESLSEMLLEKNFKQQSLQDIREIVCQIRRAKLPDPNVVGNVGSFFKNPVVSASQYRKISKLYPDLKAFKLNEESYKLAAAWLIEKCLWKGFRKGDAGVHPNQALVLVNYGNATGLEILHLANGISKSVFEKFNVILELEVNVV
ncbi:MAG: UDP-N-acetylmuramate dehydrogenase [Bacteroidota bacterium]